ncbi:MAG TPA: FHA domain-containing protein, partial [Baekduia sp.]|nr:FHA domain-containing protein [Baekduia sp.]
MSAFELVLPDRTRVPVDGDMTIGRALDSTVRLESPTVSRHHARLAEVGDAIVLEDAGSRYGTWVDGARLERPEALRDGSVVRIGDHELVLERRRDANASLRTRIVPVGASAAALEPVPGAGPRLRSGYAVKRLAASEGERRWVLKDLRADRYVRLAGEGALLELIDGRRSVAELLAEAQRRLGDDG